MEGEMDYAALSRKLHELGEAYVKLRNDFRAVYQVRHPALSLKDCEREISKNYPTLEELMNEHHTR